MSWMAQGLVVSMPEVSTHSSKSGGGVKNDILIPQDGPLVMNAREGYEEDRVDRESRCLGGSQDLNRKWKSMMPQPSSVADGTIDDLRVRRFNRVEI